MSSRPPLPHMGSCRTPGAVSNSSIQPSYVFPPTSPAPTSALNGQHGHPPRLFPSFTSIAEAENGLASGSMTLPGAPGSKFSTPLHRNNSNSAFFADGAVSSTVTIITSIAAGIPPTADPAPLESNFYEWNRLIAISQNTA